MSKKKPVPVQSQRSEFGAVSREEYGRTLHAALVDAGVVPFESYAALSADAKLALESVELPPCPGHDEHEHECPYDESKLCGESCEDRRKDLDTAQDALADAESALERERSAHADTTAMLDELLALGNT